MGQYTVRVVLHDNATWEEYTLLRERLEAIGVFDEIKADNGLWYRLPPAEYTCDTGHDATTLRSAVVNVAQSVKPNVAVLVSEATGRYWFGLAQIAGPRNA